MRKYLKLSSVSTVNHYMKILQDKGYINSEKNVPRSVEIGKKEGIQGYMPVVSFVNRQQTDIRKLLIALTQADLQGLTLNSIDVVTKDQLLYSVSIKGSGSSDTYTSLQ